MLQVLIFLSRECRTCTIFTRFVFLPKKNNNHHHRCDYTQEKKKKLRDIKSKQINRTRTDNTNNEINNRFK